MIRLGFLVVVLGAFALAYLGFSVVRGTGDAPLPPPQNAEAATSDPAPERAADAAQDGRPQVFFLQGEDFAQGTVALVIYGTAAQDTDLVVTDAEALRNAQDLAFVAADAENDVRVDTGTAPHGAVATLYRDDALVFHVVCPTPGCAYFGALLDSADPLVHITREFDTYTAYLDALAAIALDPDFAVLGAYPDAPQHPPVAQMTPSASMALPTIVRPADQPLNTETHAALLTAILREALPDGATVDAVTLQDLGTPVVVDADNGRPATAGGTPILFPQVRLYTPYVALSGVSDLPDSVLQQLTDQTVLRVDYAQAAQDFVAGLGVPCPDCFTVQAQGDTFDAAEIIHSQPERYVLTYFDLRDAP